MPFPEEAVEDAATPAKHRTLYLMDVGTPVLGLGWRRQGQSERLFPLLQSVWIRGLSHGAGAWSGCRGVVRVEGRGQGSLPTLQKVILQWQELSCVFRISTSP